MTAPPGTQRPGSGRSVDPPPEEETGLVAEGVVYGYPGAGKDAVSGIDFTAESRSITAILGPNGSGKTTLLRLLVGGVQPKSGLVSFNGRRLADWDRRQLARRLAVVTQLEHLPFPVSVEDLVAMGRYPHLGPWRSPGKEDHLAMDAAMDRCGISALRSRGFQTLSGGERQRVRIARALAQDPTVLVLDEPTASLDLHYEMAIFRLLAELKSDGGVTVVVVTHNVNLAARFADRLVLMKDGQVAVDGAPSDVLTAEHISPVFDWPVSVVMQPFREGSAPQLFPD